MIRAPLIRNTLLTATLIAAASCDGSSRNGASTSAAPDPPPVEVATSRALPHATDFLTAGCLTHLYAGLDAVERQRCRALIKARGYTHFYLYVYNEEDYGGPGFDFYSAPDRFRVFLQELRDDDLLPVVWLAPDDAPAFAMLPTERVLTMVERFIPAVDDLVSSYVLGLELEEYWSVAKADTIGARVARLTVKPIGVHQHPETWRYCELEWCDFVVLQYGFDKAADEIDQITRRALSALGKPVVAGEYESESELRAVLLGNRGVAAGASGFGNGGSAADLRSRWTGGFMRSGL